MFKKNFIDLCNKANQSPTYVCQQLGLSNAAFSQWSDASVPRQTTLKKIADYFGVSVDYLLGNDNSVTTTEDYTTFPVIGEIAAGYDSIVVENWSGDTVTIPNAWLKGRDASEYFVLSVKGDSMYPLYLDGDKVLILKCSTLDYSGQIGAVIYDDEYSTLKKVEYKPGEDWLNLVPINPMYPPQKIENEALEHCRVIGIPKILIRSLEE